MGTSPWEKSQVSTEVKGAMFLKESCSALGTSKCPINGKIGNLKY